MIPRIHVFSVLAGCGSRGFNDTGQSFEYFNDLVQQIFYI